MSDLSEFLLAQFAKDEEVARAAAPVWDSQPWRDLDIPAREHANGWDPEIVIAECEAKRRIVEKYRAARNAAESIRETFEGDDSPRARVERASYNATAHAWWAAMEIAALPYADHPGFREEWKP